MEPRVGIIRRCGKAQLVVRHVWRGDHAVRWVARLIQRGALRAGQLVPSSRVLAHDLGVSRNTVTAAYDEWLWPTRHAAHTDAFFAQGVSR